MKPVCIAAAIILLIGLTDTVLSQNRAPDTAKFSVDAYGRISSGMTRAEVANWLGDPATVQVKSLPDGPFWGPQEEIDANTLDGLRRYEEWRYEHNGAIYLIWFGDPVEDESAWRTTGKVSYPMGAVF